MGNLLKCGKCGNMIDSRGWSLHEKFCKGEGTGEKEEIDKGTSNKICNVCKSENIVRLDEYQKMSGKQFNLSELYQKGYTHVCVDCGEILK